MNSQQPPKCPKCGEDNEPLRVKIDRIMRESKEKVRKALQKHQDMKSRYGH